MRAEFITFGASLLINAAILGSFEHATTQYDQLLATEKQKQEIVEKLGGLEFEFVEAPQKAQPQKPIKTKKISDRDSVAQNPEPSQVVAQETAPKSGALGPSDQLEQKRMIPSQMPVSESRPSPEVKPTPEPEQKQKAELSQQQQPAEKDAIVEKAQKPEDSEQIMKQPSKFAPNQTPVAPIKGLTGSDRITTQAVSRTQSRGVQLSGETSFEAMGSDMGVYFKNMKERIWMAWFPYLSIHYPKDFRSADVLVRFYLSPAGEVVRVETLNYKGSPLFAAFCMEAVKKAGPYGPVPPDVLALLGQDELEVKFGFHFW